MNAKMVCFAYPSSDLARQFKMNATGCWFIALYANENSWQRIKILKQSFGSAQEAIIEADKMPNPYHFSHEKYLVPYL